MSQAPAAPRSAWQHLTDKDLLKVRICDLGAQIEGSELEPRIAQLVHELESRDLRLKPVFYLSDEWQSPDGQPAIGIPFFLTHPRLKALEFRMTFEVEGGTPSWCMKLLRHEAGHAFDHAYGLSRRREWAEVFGSPRQPYNPYFYSADPHSKRHVRNVPHNYAQCHPAEDFAETFAVWLNPASSWRSRYAGWPAMRKLRYVDRILRELAGRPAPRRKVLKQAEARLLRSTLQHYYDRKFRLYNLGDLTFSVRHLKTIFRASRSRRPREGPESAAEFVRRHRRRIVDALTGWTGETRPRIERVLSGLAHLCEQHHLVVQGDDTATLIRFTTFVSTLIVNRVHTLNYRLEK
jgi:hypothetical protein